MEKKLKFFRNIVANVVLGGVVLTLFLFAIRDGSVAVSATEKPIYKGASTENASLMVNVYWGTEHIEPMLEIFKENDVRTTFFVGGMWVSDNIELLKKIYEAGHEIANHGYFHKDHKKLGAERNREEISVTHALVKNTLGIEMNLFAPPSGSFSEATIKGAKELGYTTIMWTNDTIDWRDHDSELIFSRAVKNISGGNLVLMHPTADTVKALDRIIKAYKTNNINITPVSEVL